MTAKGDATDNPAVLFSEPRGTILPAGGIDAGHKGYALALIVEILTGGLAGFGRADAKEGWGATVFVQAIDPAAFGGLDAFTLQAEWIAQACRDNPPRAGVDAVRMPGERGLAKRPISLRRSRAARGHSARTARVVDAAFGALPAPIRNYFEDNPAPLGS